MVLYGKMNIILLSYYLQLFLVFCLTIREVSGRSCFAVQNGTFGNETYGTVSVDEENIYVFGYTEDFNNEQVYL